MPSTLLIFNSMADHGRSGQKASDLRAIVDEMGGADWQGTEYPAHAAEIAAGAGGRGYQTVVALGGDGTVHEVVNGLMRAPAEQRARLGIVPIGSGNDFAVGAGIEANPNLAMKRVFEGKERLVDVVRLQDGSGRVEYFNNTCGIGFDAAVNIRSRKIKFLHGFLMYLTATLQSIALNFHAPHMKITYDGGEFDMPLLMFTIGNGPREGGGFMTTPDSQLDDGLLDFVSVQKVSQFRMLQLVPKFMAATHVKEPDVKLGRFTRLTLEADRALPIHIDGELFAPYEADVRRVEVEVVPRAIRLMA